MESIQLQIPSELFEPAEFASFEGTVDVDGLKSGPDLYTFAQPLMWHVDVTNTGDALLVTGTVEGEAKTSCSRCLEDVTFPVTGEIEGYFLISPEAQAPEDMDDDEFDVLPADKKIDLSSLITAALMLEMPLQPLCSEDCKGLCPKCGQDLNQGECACSSEGAIDELNPFSVLRDLNFDDPQN